MRWARAVVALGAVLLLAGFAVAVAPVMITVGGQVERCDPVLDPALLAGQPSRPSTGTTPAERAGAQRVEAACGPTERRRGWAAWGSLGLAAAVLLVGATAVREAGSTGRPAYDGRGARSGVRPPTGAVLWCPSAAYTPCSDAITPRYMGTPPGGPT